MIYLWLPLYFKFRTTSCSVNSWMPAMILSGRNLYTKNKLPIFNNSRECNVWYLRTWSCWSYCFFHCYKILKKTYPNHYITHFYISHELSLVVQRLNNYSITVRHSVCSVIYTLTTKNGTGMKALLYKLYIHSHYIVTACTYKHIYTDTHLDTNTNQHALTHIFI